MFAIPKRKKKTHWKGLEFCSLGKCSSAKHPVLCGNQGKTREEIHELIAVLVPIT